MDRRSFMQSILAAGIAPYVSSAAGVLMPVRPLWTPDTSISMALAPKGPGEAVLSVMLKEVDGVVQRYTKLPGDADWQLDTVGPGALDLTQLAAPAKIVGAQDVHVFINGTIYVA